jgi:hypothetical protein
VRKDGKPSKASLRVLPSHTEPPTTALVASLPDVVLDLDEEEQRKRVRRGLDTVLFVDGNGAGARTRGFVRALLHVPLGHPQATLYSVFVEVERAAYETLQAAFRAGQAATAHGTLATRLPHLEDAFGAQVQVEEGGGDGRARIIHSEHPLLLRGPVVGARSSTPQRSS